MLNRLCLFVARRLKRAKDSHVILRYSLMAMASTFALTVVIFGFIYYGLWTINPQNFVSAEQPSMAKFLLFSFNTFFNRSTPGLSALSMLAQSITAVELISAIIVTVVLIYLFTTVVHKRYDEGLDDVIEGLRDQGRALEKIMVSECNVSMPEITVIIGASKAEFHDLLTLLEAE
jgi:hypothetical protein